MIIQALSFNIISFIISILILAFFHLILFYMYRNKNLWRKLRKSFVSLIFFLLSFLLIPDVGDNIASLKLQKIVSKMVLKSPKQTTSNFYKIFSDKKPHKQKEIATKYYINFGTKIKYFNGSKIVLYRPTVEAITSRKIFKTQIVLLGEITKLKIISTFLYSLILFISMISYIKYYRSFRKKEREYNTKSYNGG